MSMREPDLAGDIAICRGIHSQKAAAEVTAEVTDLVAALGADTATHDRTIDAPTDARLALGAPNSIAAPTAGWKTRFGNDMILLINAGRAGGLSKSQIIAAIDDTFAIPHAPAVVNTPYVSSNGVVVGSVCNCTQGQWTGAPTYTYQWKRDGTINLGTAASYTLIAADVGGHAITCIVTATNGTGSQAAPPSNAIAT